MSKRVSREHPTPAGLPAGADAHGRGCRWCNHCIGTGACCVAWDTTGPTLKAQGIVELLLKIFLFSDCRLDELAELRREDVYLDEDKIWVRAGPGGQARFVPLQGLYKAELIAYLNNTNLKHLFETKDHAKYQAGELQRLLGQVCGKDGAVRDASPAALRRAVAAWFRDKGMLKKEVVRFLK